MPKTWYREVGYTGSRRYNLGSSLGTTNVELALSREKVMPISLLQIGNEQVEAFCFLKSSFY